MKFKKSDGLAKVEDPFRAKIEMPRQEKKAPRGARLGKAVIPKEKVPIAKVRKSEAGSSSTIEGSKKRLCEPNKEEEKKMFQDLVQSLKLILNEKNEYITTLRREHNGQILK